MAALASEHGITAIDCPLDHPLTMIVDATTGAYTHTHSVHHPLPPSQLPPPPPLNPHTFSTHTPSQSTPPSQPTHTLNPHTLSIHTHSSQSTTLSINPPLSPSHTVFTASNYRINPPSHPLFDSLFLFSYLSTPSIYKFPLPLSLPLPHSPLILTFPLPLPLTTLPTLRSPYLPTPTPTFLPFPLSLPLNPHTLIPLPLPTPPSPRSGTRRHRDCGPASDPQRIHQTNLPDHLQIQTTVDSRRTAARQSSNLHQSNPRSRRNGKFLFVSLSISSGDCREVGTHIHPPYHVFFRM